MQEIPFTEGLRLAGTIGVASEEKDDTNGTIDITLNDSTVLRFQSGEHTSGCETCDWGATTEAPKCWRLMPC